MKQATYAIHFESIFILQTKKAHAGQRKKAGYSVNKDTITESP